MVDALGRVTQQLSGKLSRAALSRPFILTRPENTNLRAGRASWVAGLYKSVVTHLVYTANDVLK